MIIFFHILEFLTIPLFFGLLIYSLVKILIKQENKIIFWVLYGFSIIWLLYLSWKDIF